MEHDAGDIHDIGELRRTMETVCPMFARHQAA